MLGVASVVLRACNLRPSPDTYDEFVADFDPDVVSYWKFENTGIDARGTQDAVIIGSPELDVETIVDLDTIADGAPADGTCIAWPGTSGVYAQAEHNAAHKTAEGTIVVTFQRDSASQKSTLVAANDGGGVAGGLAVEVLEDGSPRAFLRRQSDGAFVEVLGQAGDVQLHEAYALIFKWGPAGLSLGLWDENGTLVRRATDPLADGVTGTSPIRFGAWHTGVSRHDGPYGRVIWLKRRITDGEEETLARARTIGHSAGAQALPSAPAADAYWVDPIDGSDSHAAAQARSSDPSPSANPWRTLAKAIAEWNAGNLAASGSGHVEVILRGGLSYERGNNLTITRDATSGSHLVIKGYRDDIAAGTRGGTGKFTGAKGWFVLRGNIEALETGGWEDAPGMGRNIYRTTSTQSITGKARACWLGASTYNLQLVPARDLDDLNTDNEVGVITGPIYTAPGVVKHTDNLIYIRLDPTQWTEYFDNYFADFYYPSGTVPTWGTNPSSEPLAVFDETTGFALSGVSYIDVAFWRADYWTRGVRITGNTDNCTFDYWHTVGTVYCINAGDASEIHHIDITHCDLIQNIAPWHGWTWIKENGFGIQGALQARTVDLTAFYPHHINIKHCRLVRGFDGGGDDNFQETVPHDIVWENNHFVWMRDDLIAFHSQVYNSRFMYNYAELCMTGVGRVGRDNSSDPNGNPGTVFIGFNIVDMRRPYLHGIPSKDSGEFNPSGAAGLAENHGLHLFHIDPTHSINNQEKSEWKYYHNIYLMGIDESNVGGWGWKDGIKSASLQEERYNNIVINIADAEYHARGRVQYIEQDYNIWFGDPAGNFPQNKVTITNTSGSSVTYASWAAFESGGGANFSATKHSNGDGPGSPNGWEFNGKEADPEFVNGKWETIVVGNLSSYFPAPGGNLDFAASLTGSGWPGTSPAQSYVGAYAPGNAVIKIGPEQGLWRD